MRTDVRTCRVCGCWELEACEGGCAWAAADLCTACPTDAAKVGPITRHHVVAAEFKQVVCDRDANSIVTTNQMVEFPRVVTTIRTERGKAPEIHVYVGALEVLDGDVDLVAKLLNEGEAAA